MPIVTIPLGEIFDLAKKKDPTLNPYKMRINMPSGLDVIGNDEPPEEPKKPKAKPKAPPAPEPKDDE